MHAGNCQSKLHSNFPGGQGRLQNPAQNKPSKNKTSAKTRKGEFNKVSYYDTLNNSRIILLLNFGYWNRSEVKFTQHRAQRWASVFFFTPPQEVGILKWIVPLPSELCDYSLMMGTLCHLSFLLWLRCWTTVPVRHLGGPQKLKSSQQGFSI